MKRDTVIINFGGAIAGVFGAGALSVLEELKIYPRLHSVYGVSAGCHNLAYFLARQTKLGSRVYFEDLLENHFIKLDRWRGFLSDIDNHRRSAQLLDIAYLKEIEHKHKPLNVGRLRQSKIPLMMKVFNVRKLRDEYVDGRTNALLKLAGSATILPFYSRAESVRHRYYADGAIVSPIFDEPMARLIDKNPDKRFILIFSFPIREYGTWRFAIDNFLWTMLLWIYFRKSFVLKKLKYLSEYAKLKRYLARPNVFVAEPDYFVPRQCTDKQRLMALHRHGMDKIRLVLRAMKKQAGFRL